MTPGAGPTSQAAAVLILAAGAVLRSGQVPRRLTECQRPENAQEARKASKDAGYLRAAARSRRTSDSRYAGSRDKKETMPMSGYPSCKKASWLLVLLMAWTGLACGAAPQEKPKNPREVILEEINELERLYRQQLADRWEALELNDVTQALLANPKASRRALVGRLGGVTAESSMGVKLAISSSEIWLRQYEKDKAEYPKTIAEYRARLEAASDRNLFSLGMRVGVFLQFARGRAPKARKRLEEARKLKRDAVEIRKRLARLLNRIEQLDRQALGYLKETEQAETEPWRIKWRRGQHEMEEHYHLKRMPKLQAELKHCLDSQLPWLEDRLKGEMYRAEGRVNMARENLESTQ